MDINPAPKKWLADSVSGMQFDERLKAAKDRWDQKEINIRSVKGPLPTLMYCAPRTQIPRISFLHDITDSCERLVQRFGIGSNDSDYLFEKNCHSFERLRLFIGKNCHAFERLRSKRSSAALLFQITSPKPFATNLSKDVSLNNSSKRSLLSSHEFSRYIFLLNSLLCFHNFRLLFQVFLYKTKLLLRAPQASSTLIFSGPVVSWVPCLIFCLSR